MTTEDTMTECRKFLDEKPMQRLINATTLTDEEISQILEQENLGQIMSMCGTVEAIRTNPTHFAFVNKLKFTEQNFKDLAVAAGKFFDVLEEMQEIVYNDEIESHGNPDDEPIEAEESVGLQKLKELARQLR